MKTLEVRKLEFEKASPDLDIVSKRLDRLKEKNSIDKINWKDFKYKPEISFSMAYTDHEILIKFYVTEDYFKAEKTVPNQMVCEDSCVEAFFSPEEDGIYYNLEFNGIGTCLFGSGTSRENIRKSDPKLINSIRKKSSAGRDPVPERKGKFTWTLTLAIPFGVFFLHKITSLKGKSFRANFYKCGDKLTTPHYVTWSPVKTPRPDFHRPEYFGLLKFS
jgi:hypothetical protein